MAPARRLRTERLPFAALELLQRLDTGRRAVVPVVLLALLVSATGHALAASIALPQRPDEKAPEKAPTASLFGWPLWIGGDVQTRDRYRRNFDLDDENTLELHDRLTLEPLYPVTRHVVLFAKGRGIYEEGAAAPRLPPVPFRPLPPGLHR